MTWSASNEKTDYPMAKKDKALSSGFLQGNARALKLLGSCFLHLLNERYKGVGKLHIKLSPALREFMEQAGYIVGEHYPDKRTWSRWRNQLDSDPAFLSGDPQITIKVYQWAKENLLINSCEYKCLEFAFKLITNPSIAFNAVDVRHTYVRVSSSLMKQIGECTLEEVDGDLYYVHKSGLMVQSRDFTISPSKRVDAALPPESLLTIINLAKLLYKMGTRLPEIFHDDAIELARSFVQLPPPSERRTDASRNVLEVPGEVKNDAEIDHPLISLIYNAPAAKIPLTREGEIHLIELRKSRYIVEIIRAKLVAGCKYYIKMLVAICGKTEAEEEVKKLLGYCNIASNEMENRRKK